MKSREHCLNYTGEAKCHYTGKNCDEDYVQICEDYRSDEGTYLCPYCNHTGLKALNYGSEENLEIVWECMRCGGELWYCETVDEMKQRVKEMTDKKELSK